MSSPTIQRCPHDRQNPYLQVNRELARDNSISFECRGLLLYLLSHKDGWVISIAQIAQHVTGIHGRDKIRSIFKEAMDAGYIYQEHYIEDGLKRFRYFVLEFPILKKSLPCTDFQRTGNPQTDSHNPRDIDTSSADSPRTDFQGPGNTTLSTNIRKKEHKEERTLGLEGVAVAPVQSAKVSSLESHGKHVKLSKEDYSTLCTSHGKEVVDEQIACINDYLASTGNKPYKDYAATVRNWIRREKKNKKPSFPGMEQKRKFAPCSDDNAAYEKMQDMRRRAL